MPSAPGLYSGTNFAPVCFSTISATMRNDISFPAPGPLGKITVMGFVGSHANANTGNTASVSVAKSFFIVPPNINMMNIYLFHLA